MHVVEYISGFTVTQFLWAAGSVVGPVNFLSELFGIESKHVKYLGVHTTKTATAHAPATRKAAPEELVVLTRAQMLKDLSPQARALVEKADPKTKAMPLNGWRFGRSGMLK